MELSPEQKSFLTLHLVPGLGPRLTAALLERFGSAAAVLQAPASQLQEVPHIGARLAQDLWQAMRRLDVEAELALMDRAGVRLIARGTAEYPQSLENIPGPPFLLYVR